VKDSYELQCARLQRNEWRRTAARMYELMCDEEFEKAKKIFEHFAYKFTEEDR